MSSATKIAAVIVTYNPIQSMLLKTVHSLLPQVDYLVVVDNGSACVPDLNTCNEIEARKIKLILLGKNTGIAYATNIGLKNLSEKGYDYIITSDQDTSYPASYVETFIGLLDRYPHNLSSVAAFVPVVYDEVLEKSIHTEVASAIGFRKIVPSESYTEVCQAIASGMLISVPALDKVGMMREDLFMDMVDTEWCWRARRQGMKVVCCREMRINHSLGDSKGKFGNRWITLHSPIRNYYITRNNFYLALHSNLLSLPNKVFYFLRSFRFVPLYTILCSEHILNFRLTILGMIDAFRGRLGKFQEP